MKKSLQKFCSLALVLTTATTAVAGISMLGQNQQADNGVYAEAENTTNVLKIANYKKSCDVNSYFKLPTLVYGETATIKATVISPIGRSRDVAYTLQSDGKTYKPETEEVKAEYAGNYEIKFEVTVGTSVYEANIYVKATSQKGAISLVETNLLKDGTQNKRQMASKVLDTAKEVRVPTYEVKDADGEDLAGATVEIKVQKDNVTYSVNAETGVVNFGDAAKSLKDNNVKYGTYTVVYTAKINGAYLDKTTTSFEVVDSSKYDYELSTSWNTSLQTIKVGETTTLPTLTGKNGDDKVAVTYKVSVWCDGEDVSNKYVNQYVTTGDELTVLSVNEDGEYQITANQMDKYYTVKYEVEDMFGNKTNAEFNINTIKAPSKTTPIVVDGAYSFEDAEHNPNLEILKLKDVSYKLKTYYAANSQVELLPIFAEDNSTFALKDYVSVKREVKVYSTSKSVWKDTFEIKDGALNTTANKVVVLNAADDAVAAEGQVIAKDGDDVIKLDNDKKYEVVYTVKNKYGVENSVSFYFTLTDKEVSDSVVEFTENLPETIDAGDEIEVKGLSVSNTNDERLNKYIAYRFNATGKWQELTADEDGKYIIKTKGAQDLTKVEITAVAEDDRSEYKTFDEIFNTESAGKTLEEIQAVTGITVLGEKADGVYTPESKIVNVAKTDFSDDTIAPIFGNSTDTTKDIKNSESQNYKVGEEVALPDAVLEDANISSVGFDVIVRKFDAEGNFVRDYSISEMAVISFGNVQTISGLKFQAPEAGKYVVMYVAEDGARNKAYKFFNMEIDAQVVKETPKFVSLTTSDVTLEKGDKYLLPTATVNLGGLTKRDEREYVVKVTGPSGYVLNGNTSFIANKVGTYTVKYELNVDTSSLSEELKQEVENATRTFTITVKDTKAPEINIIGRGEVKDYYELNDSVIIPFATTDAEDIDEEKSTIKVASSKSGTIKDFTFKEMKEEYQKILEKAQTAFDAKESSDTRTYEEFVEAEMNKNGSFFKLNLTRNEQYTITYTTYDTNTPSANSKTETIVFKVGDTTAPTLEVKELAEILGSKLPSKVGDDLVINLRTLKEGLIKFTDDKTVFDLEADEYPVKLELRLNGSKVTPKSVDGATYTYEDLEAGDYTLVFTVEDDAKNTTSVEKTFTISAESNEGMTDAQIIGTVLIVLSVVVLAGVIVYFVVTKRKTDKLYK